MEREETTTFIYLFFSNLGALGNFQKRHKGGLPLVSMALNINIYFMVGNYAGSTLSILRQKKIDANSRVAGGTGIFYSDPRGIRIRVMQSSN